MKKIVFIDTWINGMKFTDLIAKELSADYELYYVHADSLYGSPSSIEMSSCYDSVIDIKDYNFSFHKVLSEIKPDVVIFISMHALFQRWANFICEVLNIPTLFFPHGVRIEGERSSGGGKKNVIEYLIRVKFLLKHWIHLLMDLFRSKQTLHLTRKHGLTLFKSFMEMGFNYGSFNDCPKYKWGLTYNTICLSSEYDQHYFSNFVGKNNKTKFAITGHLTSGSAAFSSQQHSHLERSAIIFISQPLVSGNLMSEKKYIEYILWCQNVLENTLQEKFIVRKHPRDDMHIINKLRVAGVAISNERDMSFDIAKCKLVMGLNSSALIGFMDIGIPLVVLTDKKNILMESVKRYKNKLIIDGCNPLKEAEKKLVNFVISSSIIKDKEQEIKHSAASIADETVLLINKNI